MQFNNKQFGTAAFPFLESPFVQYEAGEGGVIPPPPSKSIITESGFFITTESGKRLTTE